MDSDLIADLQYEHVAPFVQKLQDAFYVSAPSIIDAIVHRGSFNLIHLETSFKVDIFVPKGRTFDHAQFGNRNKVVFNDNPDRTVYIASPEDTILAKLDWYRLGGEVSDRQWSDILKTTAFSIRFRLFAEACR